MKKTQILFETSWEVCNKVGGIHTVISTKAKSILDQSDFEYILIGPDLWRDEGENPEFEPDPELFKDWKEQFQNKAFSVKTGRWKIPGRPKAMLIDFYSLISRKDEIFSKYWEDYKLDSISGQWDYIEPALFGTAAGELIQDMCLFYEDFRHGALAHFHEWMTGAGILHLKKHAPFVGTIFTTHATSLGRALAGNGRPLYSKLNQFDPERSASELGVISKQSMESLSAINADAYSTVSEITALECKQFFGKEPDIVTPNGFEDSFVPDESKFREQRTNSRKRLIDLARSMGHDVSSNSFLVATSGRYEYKNKGIDVFLEALRKIEDKNPEKDILAFILVPAGISGPRQELVRPEQAAVRSDYDEAGSRYTTHYLSDPANDPVLNYCRSTGLASGNDSKVKLIFIPSYLNGQDGLFNISYYDLLIGFDLSIFPSYYEPWGYTPMESLAFYIPTITSTLAGFGKWVNDLIPDQGNGIRVLKRTDDNFDETAIELSEEIMHYAALSDEEMKEARKKAFEISRTALWKELVSKYFDIYDIAISSSEERIKELDLPRPGEITYVPPAPSDYQPVWKKLFVESNVPEKLNFLKELSKNLWWSWNFKAIQLWEKVDPALWEKCENNPIVLLEEINYKRLLILSKDKEFIKLLNEVEKEFHNYMNSKGKGPEIAYFSMEYGIHDSLKIFSGGLGILAGDFLKEASDSNVNITAFGLLYRHGYFKQVLTLNGEQTASYNAEQFSKIPAFPVLDKDSNWLSINIAFPGRSLTAYLWQVNVGRVKLYLLDVDHKENQHQDRAITHSLYGGDLENRIKQEILLGIGGIRAIYKLGLDPDIFHSNEGHSAFSGIERLASLVREKNLTFNEALEMVRASTLFTTHTPVPAGHDQFPEDILRTYMGHYPERLKISWEQLLSLGRKTDAGHADKFNMSFLAARLALFTNGVSKLHGQVSRKLFAGIWPGFLEDESSIGYVTNGVHYKSWAAQEWTELYENIGRQGKDKDWKKINDVDDGKIWEIKQGIKASMIEKLKERLKQNWTQRNENPRYIVEICEKLRSQPLTIGFARRFATYKRAHLLFKNLDRLSQIVNHPEHPVQLIFAGKAHPQDKAGQDMIRDIVTISKRPEFIGKIVFLQNYDIALATRLVRGVDVWMNTPTRPLEASGTSGEKAVMNGTLHFSVLDGWWVEGYRQGAGWALSEKRTYEYQDYQDEMDAETIYQLLENEIIPAYYTRNKNGVPAEWVSHIKKTMAEVAPEFTTERMMNDYMKRFYLDLEKRSKEFSKDQYEKARQVAKWKEKLRQNWQQIEVLSVSMPMDARNEYKGGKEYSGKLSLDLKGLVPEDVKLELIFSRGPEESPELVYKKEFNLVKTEGSIAHYNIKITPTYSGGFNYGFRLVPHHPLLGHDQEFALNLWI